MPCSAARRCRPSRRARRLAVAALAVAALALATQLGSAGCARRAALSFEGVDRSDGKLPELTAAAAAPGLVAIDGKLDDALWKRAPSTGPFVDPLHGRPVPGSKVNAVAQAGWDAARLYLAFTVHERDPSTPFARGDEDPHLWERASAVEIMLQPGDHGDNKDYFELQIDVGGAVWDTRFDDYNRPITGVPGQRRFGHQEWRSELQRAIAIKKDAGRYTVELALPWKALRPVAAERGGRGRLPPAAGDVWRMNLYSFRDGQSDALAWSPTLGQGNFHIAARFGKLRFGGR